jgi:dCTP deaminase
MSVILTHAVFLSARDIERLLKSGKLGITPFDKENLGPNSYLLTADSELRVPRLEQRNIWTTEHVKIPTTHAALLTARSSIARRGLFFATSIGVDSGFEGNLVIEFFNVSNRDFMIKKGEPIVHLWVAELTSKARPYRGKYQGQRPGTGLEDE